MPVVPNQKLFSENQACFSKSQNWYFKLRYQLLRSFHVISTWTESFPPKKIYAKFSRKHIATVRETSPVKTYLAHFRAQIHRLCEQSAILMVKEWLSQNTIRSTSCLIFIYYILRPKTQGSLLYNCRLLLCLLYYQ